MEIFVRRPGVERANVRWQIAVERAPQTSAFPFPRQPEGNYLPLRVNSGVGPPGGVGRDRRAFKFFERAVQNTLDRRLIDLGLPAEIIRAVVARVMRYFIEAS